MRVYPFFIPHAGCPHRCSFCQQQRTTGRLYVPSPEEVFRSLQNLLPRRGEGEVAFYGGSFTLLAEKTQRAYLGSVASFIRSGRVAGIRVSTRPDALQPGAVALLREMGVATVEIGCQSFSHDVLLRSGRGHGPCRAGEAVPRLKEAGLAVGLQLMPGLPGGDRAEALSSLGRAIALKPDFLRIYPTVVLKGTALEEDYKSGAYQPLSLEEAVDLCAELLWHCRCAGVPVIRLGLQGTPELDRGESLIAGPYHPAFGQLVRSRLWLRALGRGGGETGIRRAEVHPSDLSDARGHRRSNLEFLRQQFGTFDINPWQDVSRESFSLGKQRFFLMDLAGWQKGSKIV